MIKLIFTSIAQIRKETNTFVSYIDLNGHVDFMTIIRAVYPPNVRLDSPLKVPTPYGGRLEYGLPGQSLLVVHLKNKDKVRIKKRWSQVVRLFS